MSVVYCKPVNIPTKRLKRRCNSIGHGFLRDHNRRINLKVTTQGDGDCLKRWE